MADGRLTRATEVFAGPLVLLRELQHAGSLTAAAERLGIPQPTLSRRLARWEQELGVVLIRHGARTLELTPTGERIAQAAQAGLDAFEPRLARALSADTDTIRLGCLRSLSSGMVPRLAQRLDALGGHHLSLREGSAPELLEALGRDDLDLVLTAPRPSQPGLAWEEVMDQEIDLTVPADHPLAARHEVTLDEVADEPFLLISDEYTTRGIVDELLAERGIDPRIILDADDVRTLRSYVATGLGVSILPYEGLPDTRLKEIRIRRPDGSFAQREVGMVWRERATLPGPTRAVIDAFLEMWE